MHNQYVSKVSAVCLLSNYKGGKRIDKIFVPTEIRGYGYGRDLMRDVLDIADIEGVTLSLVICADDDAAMCNLALERWYTSLGFKRKEGYCEYERPPKIRAPSEIGRSLKHASETQACILA
jgi:predicted GNAT superfamily acetyltransferase